MQEFSASIYASFRREARRRLRFTWRETTRVRLRALWETYQPFEHAALLQAAWKDRSHLGNWLCQHLPPEADK